MSFEDIRGQDSALRILREGVKTKRIFSSYLFAGPEGIGKRETAKNFAKALNCLNEENAQPCEKCSACRKINSHVHPDVFFIEPKGTSGSIGIDQIREVIARANLKPYEAKKKVFIINDAHAMNQESSNAFLKTLEEAPQDTIFILISRSKDALLPTIVSRCHIVNFFSASLELAGHVLTEKFGIEKKEARILSSFSAGKIGKAVKMKKTGLIERKNRIINSLSKGAFAKEMADYADREELKENFEILISFFRDIFLYKVVERDSMLFHADRLGEVKKQCKIFSLEKLDLLIKKIITLRSYIDYNVNTKIIIDVLANELGERYA